MELGPIEAEAIRQAARYGRPLPDKLNSAPRLGLGLELFLAAFYDMSLWRNTPMGEQPISLRTILDYAALHEITGEQLHDLVYHVKELDKTALKWAEEQRQRDSK